MLKATFELVEGKGKEVLLFKLEEHRRDSVSDDEGLERKLR